MPKRKKRTATSKRRKSRSRSGKSDFKHRLRLLGLALTVVFATVACSSLVRLYRFFFNPQAQATSSFGGRSIWDGERPLNLVFLVVADPQLPSTGVLELGVVALDPSRNLFRMIRLPVTAEWELPLSFGRSRLQTLYGLGNLTEVGGIELAKRTVADILAVSVDGYLLLDQEAQQRLEGVVGRWQLLNSLPEIVELIGEGEMQTDLSWVDVVRIGFSLAQIRPADYEVVSLAEADLEDQRHLDSRTRQLMADAQVLEERKEVLVLNGTPTPGLATKASRFVENLGADVLVVANTPEPTYTRHILIAEERNYTAERLIQLFGIGDFRLLSDVIHDPLLGSFQRADIVLILGHEF